METPPNNLVLMDHNSDNSEKANEAFGIDMIRDTILEHAIHNGYDVVMANVLSFRSVSKAWLHSTHRILCKSPQPLFKLCLNQAEFTVGKQQRRIKNKNLCKFLLSLQESDPTHIPPHKIEAIDEFFREHNYPSFFHYLENYSSTLVELDVDFFPDKHITDPIPTNNKFKLPRLQKFTVTLFETGQTKPNSIIRNMFNFIQSVLEASEKLQTFRLFDSTSHNLVPIKFGRTRLPSSLTEIKLHCLLTHSNLTTLVNSPLSNLKSLKLIVNNATFKNGIMSSILQKFCKSLKFFSVMNGTGQKIANKQPTQFQLPLMEKLETLQIATDYLELEGDLSCLQNRLPVLKHLNLSQTNAMLRKWTDQSCFTSVDSLRVGFVCGNHRNRNGFVAMADAELSAVESLATAFSSIQQLEIRFDGAELSALVPVMRQMTSLRRLDISVWSQYDNSDTWDALLLGISVESVAELRESPALLEELQAENGAASIRNLSELHTLCLEAVGSHDFPVISDLAFNFAFFKMPKLTRLELMGGFYTTDQIKEKWEKEGRQIVQLHNVEDEVEDSQDEDEEDEETDEDEI